MSPNPRSPLLENAHDFMIFAADCAREDNTRLWKHALLSLSTGLELLLKARLESEHWSLLFAKVDNASTGRYRTGNFISVDFKTALNRLKNISNVEVSEAEEKELLKIRNIRNRLQHFHYDISIEGLKSWVGRGINAFVAFYERNFDDDPAFIYDLSESLMEFEEFVTSRMASLKEELESHDRPQYDAFSSCPNCFHDAVVIDGDDVWCLFCGAETTLEDLVESRSESYVEVCPKCGRKALGLILFNNEDGEFGCAFCGFTTESLQPED